MSVFQEKWNCKLHEQSNGRKTKVGTEWSREEIVPFREAKKTKRSVEMDKTLRRVGRGEIYVIMASLKRVRQTGS